MKKMKILKITTLLMLTIFMGTMISCEKDEDKEPEVSVNKSSTIPSTTKGRDNQNLGCIEINSRTLTIEVWDSGAIDGDIVSIITNTGTVLSNFTLKGPNEKKVIKANFPANGYNYLVLYAHNEGDYSPNTCAMTVNGVNVTMSSNLQTNGALDVIVAGYGVSCY